MTDTHDTSAAIPMLITSASTGSRNCTMPVNDHVAFIERQPLETGECWVSRGRVFPNEQKKKRDAQKKKNDNAEGNCNLKIK